MQIILHLRALPRPQLGSWPRFVRLLALWRERSRSRHQLAQLETRDLEDVGLTRLDQQRECAKWFWQP